ncbi:MAG: glycosyltransferase family 4 protein [Verrucomicrobiaceae bacterium]|nr:glycosyltransferase family 4 protein [Verrucomicrobiaceae bacterium]
MTSSPSPAGNKPRLAYLFSRYPVISQTFVDNEILGLEAAGWDVVICAIHPPNEEVRHPRLSALRAPVIYAPPPEVRKGLERHLKALGEWPEAFLEEFRETFGERTRPEQSWQNAAYFAGQLEALGVDHVHLHFANRATHAALMLKRIAGIPYSFTPQARDFLVDIESPAVLAEMCDAAEFVVMTCDWACEEIVKLCPRAAGKVRRIYNGIDPAAFSPASPSPKDGVLRILSVGRLVEFKGFNHLINAMAGARELGTEVHLDLMGDGPLREPLERQVADLGLGGQVKFHGIVTIDAVRECVARSDAFALACIKDSEGASDMLPTVITEAMLAALPVVSSRIAGVPEQVIDGVTGFVTAPGDESALAGALHRLATEPGLAARMGAAGRERALKVFSINETLPMLEAEFARLPAKASRPAAASIGTYYDLSADCHRWLLPTESSVLEDHRCQIWLRGCALDAKKAAMYAPFAAGAFWVPETAALEVEWRARPEDHGKLAAVRAKLGARVGEKDFAEAARVALWIAVQSRRIGLPRRWYVPSEHEILVLSLVHELTQVPILLSQSVLRDWPGGEMCDVLPKRPRGLTSRPRRGIARVLPWWRPWQTQRWQTILRRALGEL